MVGVIFRQEYMKAGWFILQCMLSSLGLFFFQSIVGLMDYFEGSSPRKIQISWSRSFLLKTSLFYFYVLPLVGEEYTCRKIVSCQLANTFFLYIFLLFCKRDFYNVFVFCTHHLA